MDESVRLFQEEQERLAKSGGATASFKRHLFHSLLSVILFSAVVWLMITAFGSVPRNPDNSIRLGYGGPLLIGIGAASAMMLRRYQFMPRWVRPTLWTLIALPLIVVPAMLFDTVWPNVS